jgi:hypothetical protein
MQQQQQQRATAAHTTSQQLLQMTNCLPIKQQLQQVLPVLLPLLQLPTGVLQLARKLQIRLPLA